MNTRICKTFLKAVESGVCEGFLDCYNNSVIVSGICVAVTTRIFGCSHYWVLQAYED